MDMVLLVGSVLLTIAKAVIEQEKSKEDNDEIS